MADWQYTVDQWNFLLQSFEYKHKKTHIKCIFKMGQFVPNDYRTRQLNFLDYEKDILAGLTFSGYIRCRVGWYGWSPFARLELHFQQACKPLLEAHSTVRSHRFYQVIAPIRWCWWIESTAGHFSLLIPIPWWWWYLLCLLFSALSSTFRQHLKTFIFPSPILALYLT